MRHDVPSCRARPATEACSRRSWLIAHQHARTVSNALGPARSACCSVNDLAGHFSSAQRQVRLRHTSRTGRPKQGTSIRRTSRRPWLCAITAQRLSLTTPTAGTKSRISTYDRDALLASDGMLRELVR